MSTLFFQIQPQFHCFTIAFTLLIALCRYYKLNTGCDGMPDAHSVITSDAAKFTSLLPDIMYRPTNLTSLANANLTTDSLKPPAFIYSLLSVFTTTYFIGTGLVLGDLTTLWTYVAIFSAALVIINLPTIKRMSSVAENLAKCESAFKFAHSRIRLHAETIALYGAEDVERAEISRAFDDVMENSKTLIAWQSLFQGLQVLFQYVPFLVSGEIARASGPSFCVCLFLFLYAVCGVGL